MVFTRVHKQYIQELSTNCGFPKRSLIVVSRGDAGMRWWLLRCMMIFASCSQAVVFTVVLGQWFQRVLKHFRKWWQAMVFWSVYWLWLSGVIRGAMVFKSVHGQWLSGSVVFVTCSVKSRVSFLDEFSDSGVLGCFHTAVSGIVRRQWFQTHVGCSSLVFSGSFLQAEG